MLSVVSWGDLGLLSRHHIPLLWHAGSDHYYPAACLMLLGLLDRVSSCGAFVASVVFRGTSIVLRFILYLSTDQFLSTMRFHTFFRNSLWTIFTTSRSPKKSRWCKENPTEKANHYFRLIKITSLMSFWTQSHSPL